MRSWRIGGDGGEDFAGLQDRGAEGVIVREGGEEGVDADGAGGFTENRYWVEDLSGGRGSRLSTGGQIGRTFLW